MFTIQRRLLVTLLLMGALMVLVAAAGAWGMRTGNNFQHTTSTQLLPATSALQRSQIALLRARLAMDRMVMSGASDEGKASTQAFVNESDRAYATYLGFPKTEQETALAEAVTQARAAFLRDGVEPFMTALANNDRATLDALTNVKLRTLYAAVTDTSNALLEYQDHEAASNYTASDTSFQAMMISMGVVLTFGLLITALSGESLRRAIVRPLAQAMGHFAAIAEGDLTEVIEIQRQDEMGHLLTALKAMQAKLVLTIGSVRESGEHIASASQQIASGNMDLSQRTEEQAASLEETASSMEEMTATVKHNAHNAQQAAQMSQQAMSIAQEGGQVVEQVVSTMGCIETSAKQVADILSVIDSIAFQTNILALNAAVEAARAGEQGRGFAVVAGEVRTLAQRSAVAAKDIKTLIEASNEQVRNGSVLALQAGTTMGSVVSAVRRVTDIVQEISAASHEQSVGIEQVNQAVSQMDTVTQQNAALVEEAAAASGSLDDQAQRLRTSVSVFRMPRTPGLTATSISMVKAVGTPLRPVVRALPSRPVTTSKAKTVPPVRRPSLPAERSSSLTVSTSGDWETF